MMNKVVVTLATVLAIASTHQPATAQIAQDVQSLVDKVQTQASQYANASSSLTPEQQSIGHLAYKAPVSELLNTPEVRQLLGAPEFILSTERIELKKVIQAYQKGQPVKAKVIDTEVKGDEIFAKANFFPDVLSIVKVSDPDKLANLEKKTTVVYGFDLKTGELTHLVSASYNQQVTVRASR